MPVNEGFQDGLVMLETAPRPRAFGTLNLRVVGPNRANLDALRVEWLEWLAKIERQIETDPSALANSDRSIPNLSSIVLLAECEGKTVLLTGDARSDHILAGLSQAGLLVGGAMHVDVLKVAHHGSDRNHTAKFFKAVTADTYVISADGTHGNPDHDTLAWIVEAAKGAGREIKIVVTNATSSTKQLKESHKASDFGYRLSAMPKSKHSIAVELA